MKINDFQIGEQFYGSGGFSWLCTDKGTRTICAIMLEPDKESIWFEGPPYMLNEKVFDEDEIKNCYLNLSEHIIESLESLNKRPSFLNTDVIKMMNEKIQDRINFNKIFKQSELLRRDRVTEDFKILHPYSMIRLEDGWYIKTFDIFNKIYSQVHENIFIKYDIAEDIDYVNPPP